MALRDDSHPTHPARRGNARGRLAGSLAALLWAASAPAAEPTRETVVTLFNQLDFWHLERGSNGWRVKEGDQFRFEVDEPNGFVLIELPGTGGTVDLQEAALFIAKDGRKRLVVLSSGYEPPVGWRQEIAAYDQMKGRLTRLEGGWLPEVKAAQLRRPSCDAKQLKRWVGQLEKLSIVWQLPRKGTTLTAMLDPVAFHVALRDALGPSYPVQSRPIDDAVRACYFGGVKVEFDGAAFAFRMGGTTDRPLEAGDGELFEGKRLAKDGAK
jgi:hypothetical protein